MTVTGFLAAYGEWFKTVSAVIVGGVANELGHYLADRRERKKAIGRALADLLEIRIRFIGAEMVIRKLQELFPMSPIEQAQVRALFHNLFGDWSQLAQRYNESVSTVAAVAPVLAYHLRSKESGHQIFQLADTAAASAQPPQTAEAQAAWKQQLSPMLLKTVADTLTGTCLHLAWKHSVLTLWKVHRLVKRTTELPSGANEYFAIVQELVEQQKQKPDQQPPEPP